MSKKSKVMLSAPGVKLGATSFSTRKPRLSERRLTRRCGAGADSVSHNTAALEALCQTGVVLEGGRVSEVGPALSVIRNYQQSIHDGTRSGNDCELSRSQHPVLRKVDILDESGDSTGYLPLAGLLRLQITLDPDAPLSALTLGIGIDNAIGQRVLSLHTPRSSNVLGEFANKRVVNCEIPNLPLAPGVYSARVVATSSGQQLDAVDHAVSFTVEDGDPFQEGRGFHRGVCVAQSNWSTN